ncbi:PREDICTED: 15-hydroxyprostaglandin dehydrogenase [NAD(+)]-like [Dufourea novaeangliae]|uniref:15-hydroxyprostaglandin dehydrogenase [NAD(+)] n=1 Tax=Dufourea novaeangliae TaxID=178035 RepID=A0A154PCJ3_DUFNO|nr:PREDICTED: 15-hydroxyprostaglandin dehydrogenase [NAD(+)]-like [Dufourea novaeangliae]KZC09507.1 15-hydroxyprostaglandin dehydrogenase [NAD(+)] [Dufourea novaeangliae]
MNIDGKVAIVTGGANGIGFCTARKLLRNGAKAVALFDLGDSGGESAAAELNNEFGKDRAIFVVCDVSKSEQLNESFNKVIETYETLDIVVNIAGIMDDADWEIMVDVNYKGIVHGTILGLHAMGKYKGGNGGTIVNMSSVAGLEGIPIAPIYGGTQYAIVGFTQSLKHYYDKTGIRMLTICPGLTTTAMAARFMSTKEHAMDLLDEETAAIAMAAMQKQPPEHVASAIIQLIEKGKNGEIFVSENNQPPYAVEVPSYATLKVPIEEQPTI